MNYDNVNLFESKIFLPKDDIFSLYLNANDNIKPAENNINESFDQFFKAENCLNIFSNFLENNNAISTTSTSIKQISDLMSDIGTIRENPLPTPVIMETKGKRKLLNKRKRTRLSNDAQKTNNASANEEGKKTIFKTFKSNRQNDSQCDMKNMMKLMKNRLSARKCRQKKKIYVEQMEEEIAELKSQLEKYKNTEKKEKQIENMIRLIENKEKQIISCTDTVLSNSNSNNSFQYKKKIDSFKKEHQKIQKNLLSELLKKMIKNSCPIELKIMGNKFIKIKEIENNDCLDVMIDKINENIEIMSEICNLNGIQSRIIVSSELNNYLPVKMLNFYIGLKNFIHYFKETLIRTEDK